VVVTVSLTAAADAGLNVVENYNGVNDYIFGKAGELSSNRREEQELSILCLHILQSSLGFINTLMLQDVLAGPEWSDVLGDADRRGVSGGHSSMQASRARPSGLEARMSLVRLRT